MIRKVEKNILKVRWDCESHNAYAVKLP